MSAICPSKLIQVIAQESPKRSESALRSWIISTGASVDENAKTHQVFFQAMVLSQSPDYRDVNHALTERCHTDKRWKGLAVIYYTTQGDDVHLAELLQHSTDVDAFYTRLAITTAAEKGHHLVLSRLFEHSYRLYYNFHLGEQDPLRLAVAHEDLTVIKALLAQPDSTDRTAVIWWVAILAAKKGKTEVIQCLLEKAAFSQLDSQQIGAVLEAADYNPPSEVALQLLNALPASAFWRHVVDKCMFSAAKCNNIPVLAKLLDISPDRKTQPTFMGQLLLKATKAQRLNLSTYLVELHVPFDPKFLFRIIRYAVSHDLPKWLELLEQHGLISVTLRRQAIALCAASPPFLEGLRILYQAKDYASLKNALPGIILLPCTSTEAIRILIEPAPQELLKSVFRQLASCLHYPLTESEELRTLDFCRRRSGAKILYPGLSSGALIEIFRIGDEPLNAAETQQVFINLMPFLPTHYSSLSDPLAYALLSFAIIRDDKKLFNTLTIPKTPQRLNAYLDIAVEIQNLFFVKTFLEHLQKEQAPIEDLGKLLWQTVESGQTDIASLLLSTGQSIPNEIFEKCLIYAAGHLLVPLLHEFLQQGPLPSPLRLAAIAAAATRPNCQKTIALLRENFPFLDIRQLFTLLTTQPLHPDSLEALFINVPEQVIHQLISEWLIPRVPHLTDEEKNKRLARLIQRGASEEQMAAFERSGRTPLTVEQQIQLRSIEDQVAILERDLDIPPMTFEPQAEIIENTYDIPPITFEQQTQALLSLIPHPICAQAIVKRLDILIRNQQWDVVLALLQQPDVSLSPHQLFLSLQKLLVQKELKIASILLDLFHRQPLSLTQIRAWQTTRFVLLKQIIKTPDIHAFLPLFLQYHPLDPTQRKDLFKLAIDNLNFDAIPTLVEGQPPLSAPELLRLFQQAMAMEANLWPTIDSLIQKQPTSLWGLPNRWFADAPERAVLIDTAITAAPLSVITSLFSRLGLSPEERDLANERASQYGRQDWLFQSSLETNSPLSPEKRLELIQYLVQHSDEASVIAQIPTFFDRLGPLSADERNAIWQDSLDTNKWEVATSYLLPQHLPPLSIHIRSTVVERFIQGDQRALIPQLLAGENVEVYDQTRNRLWIVFLIHPNPNLCQALMQANLWPLVPIASRVLLHASRTRHWELMAKLIDQPRVEAWISNLNCTSALLTLMNLPQDNGLVQIRRAIPNHYDEETQAAICRLLALNTPLTEQERFNAIVRFEDNLVIQKALQDHENALTGETLRETVEDACRNGHPEVISRLFHNHRNELNRVWGWFCWLRAWFNDRRPA